MNKTPMSDIHKRLIAIADLISHLNLQPSAVRVSSIYETLYNIPMNTDYVAGVLEANDREAL